MNNTDTTDIDSKSVTNTDTQSQWDLLQSEIDSLLELLNEDYLDFEECHLHEDSTSTNIIEIMSSLSSLEDFQKLQTYIKIMLPILRSTRTRWYS